MKTKKLTPRNSAPVQRENAATVSQIGNAIAPLGYIDLHTPYDRTLQNVLQAVPFAGDDAE
ncbi:anacyclamide/piricyclamide family prenylated cyclic peptide [Microcystis sp.]|uniref:anacyclamide/piricyclamide family prenylated cyclic peptide n=1 Tax=Microcystis sp. TaxID=1127 RepID=UPI00391A0D74